MKTGIALRIGSNESGVIHIRKDSNSSLVSIFVFLYIILSPIYVEQFFGISLSIGAIKFRGVELILFVLGWAICLFHLCARRNGNIVFPNYLFPLFLLIGWTVFRLLGSPDIQLGIRSSIQLVLFLLVFLAFHNFSFTERFVYKIGHLLLIVIAAQLLVGVYQIFYPVNAESAYSDIIRSRGMLGSGNGLAFFSLFLFAFFYPIALQGNRRWWIGCGMAIVCILLSQTRIALAILLVVAIVGYWISPIRKSNFVKKLWFFVAILFLIILSSWIMQGTFSQRLEGINSLEAISSQGTLLHRFSSWQKVYEEIAQPNLFFGAGGGASENFLRNLTSGEALDAVHNEYVKLQADYGIIGLLLFVWWLIAMFFVQYVQLKRKIKAQRKGVVSIDKINIHISSILVIIIFSLGSIMHNLIYAHEVAAVGWIIVGLSSMIISKEPFVHRYKTG